MKHRRRREGLGGAMNPTVQAFVVILIGLFVLLALVVILSEVKWPMQWTKDVMRKTHAQAVF